MPRLDKDTWEQIRAERETGASFGDLARKYGVNKAAIIRRAKKEEWGNGEDVAEIVRRKAAEKVTGIVTTGDPEKRAAEIRAAAERCAEIIRRHQEEPNAVRERVYAGLRAHREAQTLEQKRLAFEDLKAAKIAAEALAIIHNIERRAWQLDAYNSGQEIIIKNPRDY